MKRFLCYLIITLCIHVSYSQNVKIIPSQSIIHYLKNEPTGSTIIMQTIQLKIEYWKTADQTITKEFPFKFEISPDDNTLSNDIHPVITRTSAAVIKAEEFRRKHDTITLELDVSLNAVASVIKNETFFVQIQGHNDDPQHLVIIDNIPFTSANKPQAASAAQNQVADDSDKFEPKRLMFLNAANFDFTGDLKTNYLFHLNWFAPSEKSRFGYNLGFMKINYSNNDSSSQYVKENFLIKPLDTIKIGSKYLSQYNKYSNKIKNVNWSIYGQFLFQLTRPSSKDRIFAHAHAELLINRFSVTNTKTNIQQDTLAVSDLDSFSAIVYQPDVTTYSKTILNGYFGVGFTADLYPWKKGNIFLQLTVGGTTNYPQPASLNIETIKVLRGNTTSSNTSATFLHRIVNTPKGSGFYLIRAYYTHLISKSATVVLGTDIRGLLPTYDPMFAIYAGLNLSITDVFKLLKS